jgi:hypothetical protein
MNRTDPAPYRTSLKFDVQKLSKPKFSPHGPVSSVQEIR